MRLTYYEMNVTLLHMLITLDNYWPKKKEQIIGKDLDQRMEQKEGEGWEASVAEWSLSLDLTPGHARQRQCWPSGMPL